MDVPSIPFLLFAAVAAALFNIGGSRSTVWRQAVLLVANLAFVASFVDGPFELLPYAAFLLLGFAWVQCLRRGVSTGVYASAIIITLLAFFWLKQYGFMPAFTFIQSPYLIVGLSYVFFRVMHLVIDARYPEDLAPMSIGQYLNFTLNFTSLTSGPIQRYEDYRRTAIVAPLPLAWPDVGDAVERVVAGAFKVLVMAAGITVVQRHLAFQAASDGPVLERIGAGMTLAALYPIYLYFNFSGYTDFVIGIARFFRIALPENFDRPFRAASFIEYWSRWHMSLSNWLKTYVYNPLLTWLMRRSNSTWFAPYAGAISLFFTFFLIGAWHGRTSKFLFFGLLNGFGVALNQTYRIVATRRIGRQRFARMSAAPAYLFAGRGLTFAWVAFTLLWFWSDWPQLDEFATEMGPGLLAAGWAGLAIISAVALGTWIEIRKVSLVPKAEGRPFLRSRYVRTMWVSAMVIFILVLQGVMSAAPPEIVYKDF